MSVAARINKREQQASLMLRIAACSASDTRDFAELERLIRAADNLGFKGGQTIAEGAMISLIKGSEPPARMDDDGLRADAIVISGFDEAAKKAAAAGDFETLANLYLDAACSPVIGAERPVLSRIRRLGMDAARESYSYMKKPGEQNG